jgi:hypothetical protein
MRSPVKLLFLTNRTAGVSTRRRSKEEVMSNPYAVLEGCGRVAGRHHLKYITKGEGDTYIEGGDVPYPGSPTEDSPYKDLSVYLPVPNEPRALYVVRHAPDKRDYMQLLLAGDWSLDARGAMEALEFESINKPVTGDSVANVLPMISRTEIQLPHIIGWKGVGKVEVHMLSKPGYEGKLYSRVIFQSKADPNLMVAAYWCWPYIWVFGANAQAA